jgi:hypothetical protein
MNIPNAQMTAAAMYGRRGIGLGDADAEGSITPEVPLTAGWVDEVVALKHDGIGFPKSPAKDAGFRV